MPRRAEEQGRVWTGELHVSADRSDPFPLRHRVLCPKCGRYLSPYVVTANRRGAKLRYRYYRCRLKTGGRPPCGLQFPAYVIEEFVMSMLGHQRIWDQVVAAGMASAEEVPALQAAWNATVSHEQWRLLPEMVQCIQLNESRTRVSFELDPRLVTSMRTRLNPPRRRRSQPR